MKAFITNYDKYCLLCGSPDATDTHHLIFGRYGADRDKADEDGIYIPLCRTCHTLIHNSGTACKLSKMLGQALWELNYVADKEKIEDAREHFRKRYSKSFL